MLNTKSSLQASAPKARLFSSLPSLLVASASLCGTLQLSALEVVYQDDFDGDGVDVNNGTGGAMEVVYSGSSANWIDESENLEFIATTAGGSRSGIATTAEFDVSQGFRMELTYNVSSLTVVKETSHTTLSNRINFGLLDEVFLDEAGVATNRDVFGVSPSDSYGLGFNLTDSPQSATADSPPVGLNFNGGDGTIVNLSNDQPFTVGVHTVVLEADAAGNWSYSIDGAEATTGTFAAAGVDFDLTRDYCFYAYGQNDESAFQVVSLTIEATEVLPESDLTLEIAQNSGNLDFTWESSTGSTYSLFSTTDLSLPLESWTPVEESISADASGMNTFTIAQPAEASTFYVLEETGPLLFADFEGSDGDFTTEVTAAATNWEYGTPNFSSFGGTISGGNGDSTGAWATDLDGNYLANTEVALRTPVIDLTDVTAASLSFAEALDIGGSDLAEVYVIDDETDTLIEATPISVSTDSNFFSLDWAAVGPIALPASAYGQAVRLEFRFTGVQGNVFSGWFIDDVLVTED